MSYYQNPNYLTGAEAAELIGVSRKTIYEWAADGRISMPFTRSDIEARRPEKRARGPKRNPTSIRYTEGRHRFTARNWTKASG